MPRRSERYAEAHAEAADGEMPYISKSRVMSWVKNPEHFRLKYLEGFSVETTEAMDRGLRIHESIEQYYVNALDDPLTAMDDPAALLPDETRLWAPYIEPYISNFFVWERQRLQEARATSEEHAVDLWLPTGVEQEIWVELDDGPPWNGIADILLPAASLQEVAVDDGMVVVDVKTGKVPDEKYRGNGIYLELAYYEYVFGRAGYDIVGSGAYYPRSNTFLSRPDNDDHMVTVGNAINELLDAVEDYDGEHFETNPGPLCKWGLSDDEESSFYGICPCSWGVPANNPDTFKELVESGVGANQIAEQMNTTPDAVGYWTYKMDL